MTLRYAIIAGLFLLAVVVGAYIGFNSWDRQVAWQDGQFRSPSAVSPLSAAPTLDAKKLHEDWKKSLVNDIIPQNDGESMGLKLGNFIVTDKSGQKRLACELFETIRVRFEGAYQMSGAARSQLVVELPCDYDKFDPSDKPTGQLNHIRTVWIPMKEILKSEPGDFVASKNNENLALEFSNITEWPLAWNLVNLRFEGGELDPMEVSQREILELRSGTPLILTWIE